MAEDGMLLNFSIPETGILNKPKFKGGSWRDRLTAKKAAENWHSRATGRTAEPKPAKSNPSANANHTSLGERKIRESHSPGIVTERQIKRPRVSGEFKPATKEKADAADFRPRSDATTTRNSGDKHHASKAPKQIISSLFSFNPASKTKPTSNHAEDEAPVEPSNAPLKSELDTFTSLGISSTLASHLLKKMDLQAPTAIQKAAVSQLIKEDTDAFIQAETGSGKTLAYLLPIVQRLMELSANMKKQKTDEAVQRDSGLFAIILAPTRELSKQIALVLEKLLGCAHWIVAGTVIGGEKKKSEKARLRKGLNILVATPGRLADHLEHTQALDVSNVRWLVLDEGDRLVELGFEEEIQKIVSNLNLRMRAANKSNIPGLPEKRTTILCSATMKMDVERLGQISLKDAVHIQGDPSGKGEDGVEKDDRTFYAPAQLKQSYAVVAPKLRLVSLVSMLKRTFQRKGSVLKAIVFISCADSVDFHFDLLTSDVGKAETAAPTSASTEMLPEDGKEKATNDEPTEKTSKKTKVIQSDPTKLTATFAESPVLSPKTHSVTAYRLHGSLPQASRTATLTHFIKNKEASLMLATDVFSRGLDVNDVDLVIEYDPAFSRDDHLHRVGRTARAGRDGRACIFLMPGCEEGYVQVLKGDRKDSEAGVNITRQDAEEILKKGLVISGQVSKDKEAYMDKATELQLAVEHWVKDSPARTESAIRAYQSHLRAYRTHVHAERVYFNSEYLHLGHLAKAFALRDRPSGMKVPGMRTRVGRESGEGAAQSNGTGAKDKQAATGGKATDDPPREIDPSEEATKMRKAVRAREKFMRSAGMADEFNLG